MKSLTPSLPGLTLAAPASADKRTWGSGRCQKCGRRMVQGQSLVNALGPECRRTFYGTAQRELLFPEVKS